MWRRAAEEGVGHWCPIRTGFFLKRERHQTWGWESEGTYPVAASIYFLKDWGVKSGRGDRKSEETDLTWNCLCSDEAVVDDAKEELGPL